ncbi:hypothetical protein QA635_32520 [Bradyrhizobium brasilense]|uniref:hypothetical protein n=1 Tax=Bradyrhizobium brasilense TaxID=1419277 RepID=UPI0024B173A4|nr:hypothetical protein [Bradyrhizobium australafricanum]WFU31251.1 hypothetical protein QA635_32520 [Bradyrhizobium australafricanum]
MFEQLLSITLDMSLKRNRRLELAGVEESLQHGLALDQRRRPHVLGVHPQEVEGGVKQTILAFRASYGLQISAISPPLMDDRYLAINDGRAGNVERRGDEREPFVLLRQLLVEALALSLRERCAGERNSGDKSRINEMIDSSLFHWHDAEPYRPPGLGARAKDRNVGR